MHARTDTSEYIRWHFAVRCATRPIQSRPNRKMSRNVGNWKAYSYFFDTHTHARARQCAISRIATVFSFRMPNARNAALCLRLSPPRDEERWRMPQGCRIPGVIEGWNRRNARRRIALVNASQRREREESNSPFMRFISRKQPTCIYYTYV